MSLRALTFGCLLAVTMIAASPPVVAVDFQRDIRPLLSNTCFQCHGPDEATRAAGLRLDSFEDATGALRSGKRAIVPGAPEASELWLRINAHDPRDQMPPPAVGKSLNAEQREKLRAWIAGGAAYEPHWAFQKPEKATLPRVENMLWPRNAIDQFILARLEAEGLEPAPEAEKATLLRRVSLDLTGLPPTPEKRDAFLNDDSPLAYEKLVDDLLQAPAYGERFARMWLDLARYADTKGYEADRPRSIWRYRDWVIRALNDDLPYDQFTLWQMAGDMLPNPTMEQQLATAFHRNTMTNDEGGTDDEEYRSAAVVDRVNTTMTVWMGLTMACAQCHTHKYDPITHEEYFQVYSIFNQTKDADAFPVETPVMATPTADQARRLARLDARLEQLHGQLQATAKRQASKQAAWEAATLKAARRLPTTSPWQVSDYFVEEDFEKAFNTNFEAAEADWREEAGWEDSQVISLGTEVGAVYLRRTLHAAEPRAITIFLGSNDGIKVFLNGDEVHANKSHREAAADQDRVDVRLRKGDNALRLKIVNVGGDSGFYFRMIDASVDAELITALQQSERDEAAKALIREAFASSLESLQPLMAERNVLQKERDALADAIPQTPVLRELPEDQRRETHIHLRGNFLDHGPKVAPGVPDIFHDLPEGAPANRLAFARWLTDEDNPLTARVAVNRHWELFFGTGLVETSEDFGMQGALPSHPELLDWLAVEFRESGWSLKELARLMVTSATYRQSSRIAPEDMERDPYNRLLARGPRFRLEAEAIRDQALSVSGLLSEKMYGPSVMPPQPEGVWQVVYSGEQWVTSAGEDRYRRGLYTYLRRSSPYPSMTTFDAPSREVCTVRRINTNTPLQAMVTLNDPVYIEAAQALARRSLVEGGATPATRATFAFEQALARTPVPGELWTLTSLFETEWQHFREHPEEALTMATDPLGSLESGIDPAEAAAWTVVCNAILNLDELLTRI